MKEAGLAWENRSQEPNVFRLADRFILDNVAQYFFEVEEKETWYASDFPNCAPPSALAWYEWKAPRAILEGGKRQPFSGYVQAGALISALDLVAMPAMMEMTLAFCQDRFGGTHEAVLNHTGAVTTTGAFPIDAAVLRQHLRWAYTIVPFVRMEPHGPVRSLGTIGTNHVRHDGSIHVFTNDNNSRVAEVWQHVPTTGYTAHEKSLMTAQSNALIFPVWMGLSFLHCKNVTMAQVDPCHQRKPKHGKEVCRRLHYKILDIKPMQRLLRHEGQRDTQGLKHALSITRGHFKHFTEERKLFGKHEGTFWWPQHLRGSSDHGIIVKDYRVHTA
jgi:hypothetical protein